jgi:MerR family transcriptional regulator, copper efflux regulator
MNTRMRIGELADRSGVSQRTIRYYEQLGLLEPMPRRGAAYRYYDDSALKRLDKIAALKGLGLSLDEIADVAAYYFVSDPKAVVSGKRRVLEILETHLAEADARIHSLKETRQQIVGNIERIREFLAQR